MLWVYMIRMLNCFQGIMALDLLMHDPAWDMKRKLGTSKGKYAHKPKVSSHKETMASTSHSPHRNPPM